MNAIVQHEAPRLPSMQAGGSIKPIVPQSMEDAYRLAKAVCMAGMAPKGLDTPEKAMIAIMQGMEVGMTPMASLQRIAVVNGCPTIWGDGAMSLVRGSGLCEYVRETLEGTGDTRSAVCAVKRRGERDEVTRRFSVADAKKAGLWGKQGPWQQYPERMLQMRARAFALRDVFADVLGGMYLREEIEDANSAPRNAVPPSPPKPPAPPAEIIDADTGEIIDQREVAAETGEAAETVTARTDDFDPNAFFEELETSLAAETTAEGVEERWLEYDPLATFDGDDVNIGIAKAIKARRLRQIGG